MSSIHSIPPWLNPRNAAALVSIPYPGFQVQFLHADGDPHWIANAGPQTWMLMCPYDEILFGGRRGGGKSAGLIAWFCMGDPSLEEDDPARISYLNVPSFRGLMLRKELQSNVEFLDEAANFFRPFGCKATGGGSSPTVFEFKSGAKIYTGHLGDKEAYEKYRGHGITKIGIEELTQIPQEGWYLKLLGSLRNKKQVRVMEVNGKKRTFPRLHCQIAATTNPDGIGKNWVKARFVKVRDGKGDLIPWNTPMRDDITSLTRIFIPATIKDNPYLDGDKQYEGMLLAQDEITRKQWIDGDWDAGSDTAFSEFRPDGPIGDMEKERFPWARHVVDPERLQPWWFRFGAGDWGFQHNAVFQKFCRNERDGRIHVYDELTLKNVGSYEIGVLLAKWWIPDLENLPDKNITIALSPDAFNKTDATNTKAEQMVEGIRSVLGPYGSLLLKYNDDERAAMSRGDRGYADRMFEKRRAQYANGQMMISLKPAANDRIAGFSKLHELLRFRPVLNETENELAERLQGIYGLKGIEAYERERLKAEFVRKREILPKLALWRGCEDAIRGLTEAQTDPNNQEDCLKWDGTETNGFKGDDGFDCLRYGCMYFKEVETTIPKAYYMGEVMSKIQDRAQEDFGEQITDPTRLAMIAATQSANYDKQHAHSTGGFNLPRGRRVH